MSALLTSADFTDLISPQLLINLTNDTPGATSADESVIAAVSAAAWDEMFVYMPAKRKPAACPDGPEKDALRKVTRYGLYSRRPELVATPEGEVVRLEKKEAIDMCKAVTRREADFPGLVDLTADDLESSGSGAVYYANEVVYGPTTYRGF